MEISKTRQKLLELREMAGRRKMDISGDIEQLDRKLILGRQEDIPVWERVTIARHPERPTSLDYIEYVCRRFMEFHGDRICMDDPAMIGGVGIAEGIPLTCLGHQKGRTLRSRIHRNVGMGEPSGYRKVLRLAKEAEKFGRPVITFIDTPGVRANIRSEEQGIGEAIARNLLEFSRLQVPVIAFVIGEGGSAGALALAVADKIFMLENAVFYLISPEGLASIHLKDPKKVSEAAENLRLTAGDLMMFGIVDGIIPEGTGGAHLNFEVSAEAVRREINTSLKELRRRPPEKLIKARQERLRRMGRFYAPEEKKPSRLRRILRYRPSEIFPRSYQREAR